VLDRSVVEQARRDLPPEIYQELYEARAADDSANPFGLDAIREGITSLSFATPVAWGWDLARSIDWTVGIALDREGAVCRFERWQMPWLETISRIRSLTGSVPALVDSTGLGDPVVDALRRGGGSDHAAPNFQGFNFTATSKQQLMEGLAVAIQRGEIRFPDGAIVAELESFEFEHSRTGVRYSSPPGMHDDCVCALALALHRKKNWRESRMLI
jgi:hypothetical protein